MYGIYANIWGILMGSMLPYIAYMDPMGIYIGEYLYVYIYIDDTPIIGIDILIIEYYVMIIDI